MNKKRSNKYPVYVTNNSNKRICLQRNTPIAEIGVANPAMNYMQIAFSHQEKQGNLIAFNENSWFLQPHSNDPKDKFYDLEDINSMRINPAEMDHKNCKQQEKERMKARKEARKRLERDKNLDDDERELKLKHFDEKGYFTYPVTTVMDKKKTIIEFKKDTNPKSDEELMQDLDLSHLEGEQKEMMKKVFKENINVFSRSEMDIPQCDLVQARPELTQEAKKKGVQNSKFREIPAQIRDEVEDVLSSMIKAGILKFSNKPTHIVSNLLCVPKKIEVLD